MNKPVEMAACMTRAHDPLALSKGMGLAIKLYKHNHAHWGGEIHQIVYWYRKACSCHSSFYTAPITVIQNS